MRTNQNRNSFEENIILPYSIAAAVAQVEDWIISFFSPPAVNFQSFYWLSLGENRVMHHFMGSTLEAKIQSIILLKHHFTSSFLKKKSPAAPIIS